MSGCRRGCGLGDRSLYWENEVGLGADCPHPIRLRPRGSLWTLPGTRGKDTFSPGADGRWRMGDTTPVPFRKEWVQVVVEQST